MQSFDAFGGRLRGCFEFLYWERELQLALFYYFYLAMELRCAHLLNDIAISFPVHWRIPDWMVETWLIDRKPSNREGRLWTKQQLDIIELAVDPNHD